MNLRPYQQAAADLVRSRGMCGRRYRLCLQAPTGAGKTLILGDLLRDPVRQTVITHRRVLLDQTSRVLSSLGIPHGFIASGRKPNPVAPIQLAMTQTLVKRWSRIQLPECERLHIDEIHTQCGPIYSGLFDEFVARGANLIGYTATPANLSCMVDEVVTVVTVPELIKQGYLCPPIVFGCGQPDIRLLEKLRRDAAGEYSPSDVDKLIKPQIIFGRVVEHYRRLNPDKRPFILFAHSVKASIWWAQSLTAKGISTAHIDGDNVWVDGEFHKSDTTKRAECFARVESGDLAGLSNRFVLREGVDLPCVGHAILTCPVGSRVSFVQMCGRVLRPYPGREFAIIQDHSGSSISHPPLDSAEPWDWQAPPGLAERIYLSKLRRENELCKEKEPDTEAAREPIVCPKCMAQRMTGSVCPYCGFTYAKKARYVIQTDGTLRLVEGKSYKPRHVTRKPDDAKIWERLYWGARKNKPNRTPEQIRAYFAYQNHWRWMPRDLPLMPATEAGWFQSVGSLRKEDLIS